MTFPFTPTHGETLTSEIFILFSLFLSIREFWKGMWTTHTLREILINSIYFSSKYFEAISSILEKVKKTVLFLLRKKRKKKFVDDISSFPGSPGKLYNQLKVPFFQVIKT